MGHAAGDLTARSRVEPGRTTATRSSCVTMICASLAIAACALCAEQEGDYAISVANRGFATQITVEFGGHLRDSACTFCGQCVQTCPTGALADKKALRFAENGG